MAQTENFPVDLAKKAIPYKRFGSSEFLVTDHENEAIYNSLSDQIGMEEFMTVAFAQPDGTWKIKVSSMMFSGKNDADGGDILAKLLDGAGFTPETPGQ